MSTFIRRVLTCGTLVLAVSTVILMGGCVQEHSAAEDGCKSSRIPCLSGSALVELDTTRGRIRLQLDGANAPLTAGNFLDLVKRGTYNGTVFHRVVRTPLPFVVQGGDPGTANPKVPPSSYGTGNFVDPTTGEARFIPLEVKLKGSGKIVYGQEIAPPAHAEKPLLTHDRGAVAMARSSDPNSASSQFYIALEGLPELDGRYAVFGRVVQGMDVVDRIQQGDKLLRARVLSGEK